MTEEEGGEEGKGEEAKVPRTLLKAMDEFYKDREAVFEDFDEILATYSKGDDIGGGLKNLERKKPPITIINPKILFTNRLIIASLTSPSRYRFSVSSM